MGGDASGKRPKPAAAKAPPPPIPAGGPCPGERTEGAAAPDARGGVMDLGAAAGGECDVARGPCPVGSIFVRRGRRARSHRRARRRSGRCPVR